MASSRLHFSGLFSSLLVIIGYLDVKGVTVIPLEADPPFIVNANGKLPYTVFGNMSTRRGKPNMGRLPSVPYVTLREKPGSGAGTQWERINCFFALDLGLWTLDFQRIRILPLTHPLCPSRPSR